MLAYPVENFAPKRRRLGLLDLLTPVSSKIQSAFALLGINLSAPYDIDLRRWTDPSAPGKCMWRGYSQSPKSTSKPPKAAKVPFWESAFTQWLCTWINRQRLAEYPRISPNSWCRVALVPAELPERLKQGEKHLDADHQIPIEVRPDLRLSLDNLRTRCNSLSQREDDAGVGRPDQNLPECRPGCHPGGS